MTSAIKSAARTVLDNVLLAALNRIIIPVLGAALIWLGSQWVDFGQRLKVLETSRLQGRAEIIGRIESLETHDREDARSNAEIIKKIAGIEANQSWQLRALDRIETLLSGAGRQQK